MPEHHETCREKRDAIQEKETRPAEEGKWKRDKRIERRRQRGYRCRQNVAPPRLGVEINELTAWCKILRVGNGELSVSERQDARQIIIFINDVYARSDREKDNDAED